MEINIDEAIKAHAIASVINELIFDRYDRLVQELVTLPVNSPERNRKYEATEPLLELANHSQLRKEQTRQQLINIWSTMDPAPIFESLTLLDLPISNDPITTTSGTDAVTLTRETVQEWIAEELAFIARPR